MFVDLHMHEMRYSPDSKQCLEDMVVKAKQMGLDAIAITDHDSMEIADFAQEYVEKVNFPIYVGVEYYSLQGDIVTFGITDFPKERIPAQDFINYVYAEGGVTIAAHPFRNNNRGLEHNLATIKNLTGVEVLNGSTTDAANLLAYQYCQDRGMAAIGSSDSHVLDRVGRYATYLEEEAFTTEELVEVIKKKLTKPAIHTPQGYVIFQPQLDTILEKLQ
ncbi:MAG: PHP domain-containing protein [Eubacteriales bacterium]|nr:PHP domain-containing protein [Clostridiales bacterium]MDY5835994.1 PHP domain-containing protein [Eubacteriales bacterium]